MSDVTSWIETKHRKIYAIPSPTNLTEVTKAVSAIKQDLDDSGISYYDDTVLVEAWDEQVRFSFELPAEEKR